MYFSFNIGWVLYNLLAGFTILNMYKKVPMHQRSITITVYIVLAWILSIFGNAISPDYTSYKEIVEMVSATKDPFTHVEDIYVWLIHKIGNNLLYFQFLIFSVQFIVLWILFDKVWNIHHPLFFLALFSTFALYSAIVGRYYLFISIFTLGLSLIVQKRFFWGWTLFIISIFLHKGAVMAIPIGLLALLNIKVTKKKVYLLLILLIIANILLRKILTSDIEEAYSAVSEINGSNYLLNTEGANEGGSLWWQIIYGYQDLFKYLFGGIIVILIGKNLKQLDNRDRILYNFFAYVYIASVFIRTLGLPDTTLSGRLFTLSI